MDEARFVTYIEILLWCLVVFEKYIIENFDLLTATL